MAGELHSRSRSGQSAGAIHFRGFHCLVSSQRKRGRGSGPLVVTPTNTGAC